MTGTSDFFSSADPLLSANNSLFSGAPLANLTPRQAPPSPPWDENDLDGLDTLVDVKDVDEFLNLSPESLRLDGDPDEVISSLLTAEVDLDDLSTSSSDVSTALSLTDLLSNNSCHLLGDDKQEDILNNNKDFLVPMTAEPGASVGHCSVCALVFTSADLLEKHRQEYANRVTCCHCQKSFSTLSKLKTHHRKHSKEKPFQCSICGKYYTHRNTLARHQLLYCRPLKIKTEIDAENNESHSDLNDLTKMILKAQVVLDVPAKTNNNNNKRKQEPLTSDNKEVKSSCKVSKKGDLTQCLVCDMEFFDNDSLENHREYHLKHRECCRCHKVLGNKSKLLTHHRSHTKELPYDCSLCSKSFAELSTLRKHEATHGERNFRCEICSKAFVRKDYLSKHLLTHRQTFKCSQCSFICHNRLDIESHLSQHH